ncbi:hypothetical protein NMG60_11016581 [Bertholletia excelsa]
MAELLAIWMNMKILVRRPLRNWLLRQAMNKQRIVFQPKSSPPTWSICERVNWAGKNCVQGKSPAQCLGCSSSKCRFGLGSSGSGLLEKFNLLLFCVVRT